MLIWCGPMLEEGSGLYVFPWAMKTTPGLKEKWTSYHHQRLLSWFQISRYSWSREIFHLSWHQHATSRASLTWLPRPGLTMVARYTLRSLCYPSPIDLQCLERLVDHSHCQTHTQLTVSYMWGESIHICVTSLVPLTVSSYVFCDEYVLNSGGAMSRCVDQGPANAVACIALFGLGSHDFLDFMTINDA